jgi:hypothetical protein
MLKLHCSDLWDELERLSKSSTHRYAAVAYVSDDSRVRFRSGDILIADASEGAIKTAQTSAKVLNRAFAAGAEVFSCPGLHSKVMVFDRTVVIGSANVSGSSAERLLEAAVVTDDSSIVSAARKFVFALRGRSTRLQEPELKRLLKIPVVKGARGGGKRKPPVINPEPGAIWIAGTFDRKLISKKEWALIEKGRVEADKQLSRPSSHSSCITFWGNSKIRHDAKEGDWIVQMRRPRRDGGRARVFRRAPIVRVQIEPTCTRIYYEKYENAKLESLSWTAFKRIADKVGIASTRLRPRSVGILSDTENRAVDSLWQLELAGK